jgi:hypothetical protein
MSLRIEDVPDVEKVSLDFRNDRTDKSYFNIEISPTSQLSNTSQCTYNQQFQLPILMKPSDYYCAISSFSIPTDNIPVFIPQFQSGTTLIYSVTLAYNGTGSMVPLVFVPQNGYASTSEFYNYVYNYNDMLLWLNTALASAFSNINPPVGSTAPYMIYDPDTLLFSLIAQTTYYDLINTVSPISVYFNYPLYCLFQGMPAIQAPEGSIPDPSGEGLDYLINITSFNNNFYNPPNIAAATPPAYYNITQEYNNLRNWSPLASVRITTSMPMSQEVILSSNSSNILTSSSVLATFFPIYNVADPRPADLQYVPSLYHLVNMFSNAPLQQIQLSVVWIDQLGISHPVYIPSNSVALIQLAFFRKGTFTS